ncbi:MAG TPA: trehalose utilization protein ThuA, partial [Clostridia bacterium]|nr:trehalose utilization protein ThuA [Clostridia bacterium]
MRKIRVTVWNEYKHEVLEPKIAQIYPNGIHNAIAEGLKQYGDYDIKTATLDQPEHGLTQEVLDNTDVLGWWGHMAHHLVSD